METEGLLQIAEIVSNSGFTILFLWLYVQEVKDHKDTLRHAKAIPREKEERDEEYYIEGSN